MKMAVILYTKYWNKKYYRASEISVFHLISLSLKINTSNDACLEHINGFIEVNGFFFYFFSEIMTYFFVLLSTNFNEYKIANHYDKIRSSIS